MAAPIRIRGGTLTDAEAALSKKGRIFPDQAPELRALSVATLAELRKTRGDRAGNRGPRCIMLAGYETPRDGGEGVFVWHDTLATPDNAGQGTAGVVEVAGVDPGRWVRAQLYPDPVPQHAALLAVTTLAGSGSHVPNASTVRVRVRGWAGGGGGGGAVAGAGSIGGGGGAGGYFEYVSTVIPASFSYSVGGGGAGGTNTGGTGGVGGDTTFTNTGVTCTAKGGNGGIGDTSGGAFSHFSGGGNPSAVSTISAGTLVAPGAGIAGNPGMNASGAVISGAGGSTALGGGGQARIVSSAGAAAVANTGGGGGGALDFTGAAAAAGGAGAAGTIIVEEFG